MTKDNRNGPSAERLILPDCPQLALFLAQLLRSLGGSFDGDSKGRCYVGRPFDSDYLVGGRPQFSDARPHEKFHSDEEWQGALKLVDYCLHRLSDSDKDLIFGMFAHIPTDPTKFDFRDLLR